MGKHIGIKEKEYPKLCIVARLMVAISGSNSNVERAFSILRLLLSDRRLSTSHALMENRLREYILVRPVELYKNRKRKLDNQEESNKLKSQRCSQEASPLVSETVTQRTGVKRKLSSKTFNYQN